MRQFSFLTNVSLKTDLGMVVDSVIFQDDIFYDIKCMLSKTLAK